MNEVKIFLVGGGTGGPTTPLLAIAEEVRGLKPAAEIFFIGHRGKIDSQFLQGAPFPVKYLSLPAGKWRRYFSLLNVSDVFKTILGFIKALYLMQRFRPDIVVGAGSFVQVPVAWAAFFYRVPVIIHQQDLQILLSTRLAAPAAKFITVSFDLSAKELPSSSGLFSKAREKKIIWTGNPVRRAILEGSREEGRKLFHLRAELPVLLVMGGGTGAEHINEALEQALPELLKYVEVIHITGGRSSRLLREQLPESFAPRYHDAQFLGRDLAQAYAAADLVLARGGMATIAELSSLGKPAILVPLPGAQEENARLLAFLQAAVGVSEAHLKPQLLVRLVRKILWSREIQETLRENINKIMPHDAAQKLAKLIVKIYEERHSTK